MGFTNIDDAGQEGIELAYDHSLRGKPGSKRVLQDRLGNIIADMERIEEARPGMGLKLSIDKRIQYLAYKELKATAQEFNAHSATMVILDVVTGEIYAMVNQPGFNPNAREQTGSEVYRNRAVTDVFEPGSTMKPFTVAAALDAGLVTPQTMIDTHPGSMYVGRNRVQDIHNYGLIDVSAVIQKSSNVGVSKLALQLEKEYLWKTLSQLGFGVSTALIYPGEQAGVLNDFHRWAVIDQATVAYGYGVSTTAVQLARAYNVLANGGMMKPVTLQPVSQAPTGTRVFKEKTAQEIMAMMESVVSADGTALQAKIPGYRVAGKTGTVRKLGPNGYADRRYLSLFAGIVPVSKPRLVGVVMVDDPQGDKYYGGLVAAPVFSKVMAGA
ncbi:MAG: cell division protein FtsI (penicillin-binding protein 3), partial [Halothiobacillaceae bacterium]